MLQRDAFSCASFVCLHHMGRAAFLLSVAVTSGCFGCGDLSQEDLLFQAALPPKEAVAVRPPGTDDADGQALTVREQGLGACEEGDLRCDATEIAAGFNGLTFVLLDVVDGIASLPPTLREPGRRVWGPHFDEQKNQTFRFEMVREPDGVTFSFCLHAAQGRLAPNSARGERNADVDCTSEDGELVNIFSGAFEPSGVRGDGARQGKGTMRFEALKVSRFDDSEAFGRTLDFVFDNRDDETHIAIEVEGTRVGDVERTALYAFDVDAEGNGRFSFEAAVELVGGLPQEPEEIVIEAVWQPDLAGRALGTVRGGNLAEGVEANVHQCWGADLATTFRRDVDGAEEGAEDACLFSSVD